MAIALEQLTQIPNTCRIESCLARPRATRLGIGENTVELRGRKMPQILLNRGNRFAPLRVVGTHAPLFRHFQRNGLNHHIARKRPRRRVDVLFIKRMAKHAMQQQMKVVARNLVHALLKARNGVKRAYYQLFSIGGQRHGMTAHHRWHLPQRRIQETKRHHELHTRLTNNVKRQSVDDVIVRWTVMDGLILSGGLTRARCPSERLIRLQRLTCRRLTCRCRLPCTLLRPQPRILLVRL